MRFFGDQYYYDDKALINRREGQISWYVYKYFGSKHEYIKHQNNYIMNCHTSWSEDELFNPEDYDLD